MNEPQSDCSGGPLRVIHVDALARRHSRVLLSKRLLRAFAVATLSGVLMGVALVLPALLITSEPGPPTIGNILAIGVILAVAALGMAVTYLYVRALTALAAGSRRAIAAIFVVVAVYIAGVGFMEIASFLRPYADYPFHFLSMPALVINTAVALALVIGPFEMWRADAFARAVLTEPRLGKGSAADWGRLLDLPDVSAFGRVRRIRARLLIAAALFLEGGGFYALVKWGWRLSDAAAKQIPNARDLPPPAVLVPIMTAAVVASLYIGFLLLRLTLRGARRLRLAARRSVIQSAGDVVSADPRPPVLFLRSFVEDQVPLHGAPMPLILRAFDPGTEYRTLEEMIVHGLTYVGPVVAVADPSRATAPVGAARWRVGDQEWQRFVEGQMRSAARIIVALAESSGLRWEIEALKALPGALDKAVFVFPPGTTRGGHALGSLVDMLELRADTELLQEVHVLTAARGADGTIAFCVSATLTEVAYYVALRSSILLQREPAHARSLARHA